MKGRWNQVPRVRIQSTPESQNDRFSGVTCEQCGNTFATHSAAERHRFEAHTPKGVLAYFHSLDLANKLCRGEIKNIGYGVIVHKGYVPHKIK
jgi:hypothetical protein